MKTIARLITCTAAVAALAACQTTDLVHADLAAANAAVNRASNDPQAARQGALELQSAQQTLRQAEAAWVGNRDEDLARHLAYLAQQRARTALALGELARSEAALQNAGSERERIRLQARTLEAERITQQAQAAQFIAQTAQSSAQAAQSRAQAAQASAQQEAELSRLRAEQQTQLAQQERERAAALERDLQTLQGRNTARGVVVTLGDVLFATGRADLFAGAQRSVDQLANVLRQYPERRVLVEGFTDSVGSSSANLALSQRRAEAFAQALQARGVNADRMEVRAHGASYPVADNRTLAGRQQNRRVEVLFSDAQGRFGER